MPIDNHDTGAIPMPELSDDAVVQIHCFIEHFLDLFQARYGDQIHRFYNNRSAHHLIRPEPPRITDDPPF